MTYEVKWTDTSLKQLEKFDKGIAERIIDKVEHISKDPFMFVKKLKGLNLYSLRIGDHRAIINIEGKKMIIFVLEVGHRNVIYRKY